MAFVATSRPALLSGVRPGARRTVEPVELLPESDRGEPAPRRNHAGAGTRRDAAVSVEQGTVDVAFAGFVRDNMPALSRTAYLMTGAQAAAEDLVQETLLRLYKRRDWLLNADVPLAYARRAMANQFVNDKRRRASTELVVADVPEPAGLPDATGQIADRDVVWRLLSGLPERQRAALVLRFYHDLPDAEVAEALGCRVGTVRSLVSRALSTMRSDPAMAGQWDGGVR